MKAETSDIKHQTSNIKHHRGSAFSSFRLFFQITDDRSLITSSRLCRILLLNSSF